MFYRIFILLLLVSLLQAAPEVKLVSGTLYIDNKAIDHNVNSYQLVEDFVAYTTNYEIKIAAKEHNWLPKQIDLRAQKMTTAINLVAYTDTLGKLKISTRENSWAAKEIGTNADKIFVAKGVVACTTVVGELRIAAQEDGWKSKIIGHQPGKVVLAEGVTAYTDTFGNLKIAVSEERWTSRNIAGSIKDVMAVKGMVVYLVSGQVFVVKQPEWRSSFYASGSKISNQSGVIHYFHDNKWKPIK